MDHNYNKLTPGYLVGNLWAIDFSEIFWCNNSNVDYKIEYKSETKFFDDSSGTFDSCFTAYCGHDSSISISQVDGSHFNPRFLNWYVKGQDVDFNEGQKIGDYPKVYMKLSEITMVDVIFDFCGNASEYACVNGIVAQPDASGYYVASIPTSDELTISWDFSDWMGVSFVTVVDKDSFIVPRTSCSGRTFTFSIGAVEFPLTVFLDHPIIDDVVLIEINADRGFGSVVLESGSETFDGTLSGRTHTFEVVPGTYTVSYTLKNGYSGKVVLTDLSTGADTSGLKIVAEDSDLSFNLSGPVHVDEADEVDISDSDDPATSDESDPPYVAFVASAVAALLILIAFWISKDGTQKR